MLGDSHTSFLGPKVPEKQLNTSYAEGAEAVLGTLGYRIGVTKTVWAEPYLGGADQVKLTFENNGVAPMYWDWPVYLYGYNAQNELLYKLPVELKLTDLLPGKKIQTVNELSNHPDVTSLYIGIEDPMTGQPAIQLISSQEVWGNISLIHEW